MGRKIDSYERGLALELKLCELFKNKGYKITHNTNRQGRSGAEHKIDILAEYICPLHTSKLVIEAKSYDSPIDKDRIMKLIQIVDDIGADRGIIVTTSYFTPSAIMTAEDRNIELWDRGHLVKLLGEIEIAAVKKGLPEKIEILEHIVRPRLTHSSAMEIIESILEKRARGGAFGRGKIIEQLEAVSSRYHPYYEAEVQVKISEIQKTGLISKKIVEKITTLPLSADAVTGELVTLDKNGISYPYGYLGSLNEDEIKALKTAVRRGNRLFIDHTILMGIGYSDGKSRKIVNSLSGKGIVTKVYGYRMAYVGANVNVQFPYDPRLLKSISSVHAIEKSTGKISKTLPPAKDASAVIKALENYWTDVHVKKIDVVYYPYFVYVLTAEDGSKRVETLDAITGVLNESFGKRLKWDVESLIREGKATR